MQRAAILIGVRKTGTLPLLQAVDAGLAQMETWITSQSGFRNTDNTLRLEKLTDSMAPVTTASIIDAVNKFVDEGVVEQLIIYFAGHGIAVAFEEFWLCSNAAKNSNEAINVASSCEYARWSGIPHVVFISDACRVPAQSIAVQSTGGSNIFPMPDTEIDEGYVDMFYATSIGQAALEVRPPGQGGVIGRFHAVYTSVLTEALRGAAPEILEAGIVPDAQYVRPWKLFEYLKVAVPKKLSQLGVTDRNQRPRSLISSPPNSWIAELKNTATTTAGSDTGSSTTFFKNTFSRVQSFELPEDFHGDTEPSSAENKLLRFARKTVEKTPANKNLDRLLASLPTEVPEEPNQAWRPTGCAVTGIEISDAITTGGIKTYSDKHKILLTADKPASGLVVFKDGYGVFLPFVPDFTIQVAYEKSTRSIHDLSYVKIAGETIPYRRSVSETVKEETLTGCFSFSSPEEAEKYVQSILRSDTVDPLYSIYVALALHDIGRREDIRKIDRHLASMYGRSLLDLYVMTLRPGSVDGVPDTVFPVPLVTRAWNILNSKFNEQSRKSSQLKFADYRSESFWTILDPRAVKRVRKLILSGEIR